MARRINPLGFSDEGDKEYRISVVCQEDAEPDIRLMLIHANTSKTLFLNHLESGDVIGDKVEIVADFCSMGRPKNQILEEIVSQVLRNNNVVSAGWEILH